MKNLSLTTDKALLLEEIIAFWLYDYKVTGAKHSMMKQAEELLTEVKKLT